MSESIKDVQQRFIIENIQKTMLDSLDELIDLENKEEERYFLNPLLLWTGQLLNTLLNAFIYPSIDKKKGIDDFEKFIKELIDFNRNNLEKKH